VDITNQTVGLVGSVEDRRPAGAQLWVKTGTGLATKEMLEAVRHAPMAIVDRRGFAVSRKLQAKLATFVGTALGTPLTSDELQARGYLIGHVVGKLSEGTPDPLPVAGAMVTSSATGAVPFEVLYPNADLTAKLGATGPDGIFLVVARTASPVVTSWSIVPPDGDARAWDMVLAGTSPGNAFVAILPARE
jgi:hypothetical protein